jgi:hypothetical protein
MTVFQLKGPQSATTVSESSWAHTTSPAVRPGRHAVESRARLTLKRLFYVARHTAH